LRPGGENVESRSDQKQQARVEARTTGISAIER
jgi:hypothetical protein